MLNVDTAIIVLDRALKVLTHAPNPQKTDDFSESIPLMRTNYAGEVAAQGLYLGAWCFEKDKSRQSFYTHAMEEEFLHLDWCGERVSSLGGRVSYLNPLWFLGAFTMGSLSQVGGDSYALGFVFETEAQVLQHLRSHLDRLPSDDHVSRNIVEKMIEEEALHANDAKNLGAKPLPKMVKQAMHCFGTILTKASEII